MIAMWIGIELTVYGMGLVFLLTLFMVRPSFSAMLGGLLVPSLPQGSLLTIMALIGTTVVPYNLFLHASAVQEKWDARVSKKQALRESRIDASLSIGLGGLITLAIMSTSAATFFGGDVAFSAASMSQQLEPLLGAGARYLFAAGLFAAGYRLGVTVPPPCTSPRMRTPSAASRPGLSLAWT